MKRLLVIIVLLWSSMSRAQMFDSSYNFVRTYFASGNGMAYIVPTESEFTDFTRTSSQQIYLSLHKQSFGLNYSRSYELLKKIEPGHYETNILHTISLMYGINKSKKIIIFNALGGIGYSFGEKTIEYTYPNGWSNYRQEEFKTVSFLMESNIVFVLHSFIGVRLCGQINLNPEINTGGVMVGIVFGKLR